MTDPAEVMRVSGKTGIGIEELLAAIVERVPPPAGDPDAPAQGAHLQLATSTPTRASSSTSA